MRRGWGPIGTTPRRWPRGVSASPVRAALVAALDDWASCADRSGSADWVLAVARLADPDPWRDQVRDPETWDDPAVLAELAAAVHVSEQSPQLLMVLGGRLGPAVATLRPS